MDSRNRVRQWTEGPWAVGRWVLDGPWLGDVPLDHPMDGSTLEQSQGPSHRGQ